MELFLYIHPQLAGYTFLKSKVEKGEIMDKKQLLKLSKSVNCEYEAGIWSEVESFIDYNNEKIVDYTFKFKKEINYFELKVKMKKDIFSEINCFFMI